MKAKYKAALAIVWSFALGAAVVMCSTTAFAQGTAAEAKAMLEKAVTAVKADKAKALDMFNTGEGDSLTAISMCFALTSATGRCLPLATLMQNNSSARMAEF